MRSLKPSIAMEVQRSRSVFRGSPPWAHGASPEMDQLGLRLHEKWGFLMGISWHIVWNKIWHKIWEYVVISPTAFTISDIFGCVCCHGLDLHNFMAILMGIPWMIRWHHISFTKKNCWVGYWTLWGWRFPFLVLISNKKQVPPKTDEDGNLSAFSGRNDGSTNTCLAESHAQSAMTLGILRW